MQFEDLVEYFEKIEKLHPEIYTRITKIQFEKELKYVKDNWENLNKYDQLYELYRLNALLGDMHTSPILPLKSYPYRLDKFDDNIYLVNINKEHMDEKFIHSKLIAINNIKTKDLLAMIKPIISTESSGLIDNESCWCLCHDCYLKMCNITKSNEIHLTLEKDGITFDVPVLPYKKLSNTAWVVEFPKIAEIEVQNNYVYLNINSFKDSKKHRHSKILEIASKEIEKGKPFIIDVRNNTGGYFAMYDNFLSNIETNNIKGFCLINHNSCSSAVLLAQALKNLGFILVGDTAAQPPVFFGGVGITFETKNGLNFRVSSGFYDKKSKKFKGKLLNRNFDAESTAKPLSPDIEIKRTINDVINNKDPVLEYCKNNIKNFNINELEIEETIFTK